MNGLPGTLTPTRTFGRISGQTWISIHDCPLSESTCKLLNRVVPNGTLRGVEGEGQISPIRLRSSSVQLHIGLLTASEKCKY